MKVVCCGAGLQEYSDPGPPLLNASRSPAEADALGLGGSAFVAMLKTVNLRNGNDRSSFGWLHWPRLRCVLLQS